MFTVQQVAYVAGTLLCLWSSRDITDFVGHYRGGIGGAKTGEDFYPEPLERHTAEGAQDNALSSCAPCGRCECSCSCESPEWDAVASKVELQRVQGAAERELWWWRRVGSVSGTTTLAFVTHLIYRRIWQWSGVDAVIDPAAAIAVPEPLAPAPRVVFPSPKQVRRRNGFG